MDVSDNIALEELFCSYNQLTSLNFSNNTVLNTLACGGNELTSLNVSNNTALTWLVCHENQLTSLDVSALAAITVLLCNNNELSILDVSHNIFLGFLSCGNNQLTSLDISNNTALGTHMLTYKLLVLDIRAELLLKNMPTLYEVCVSESFIVQQYDDGYSHDDSVHIDTTGSPNVYFTTECSGSGIDITKHSELTIYPNPTDDLLSIETEYPDLYSIDITSLNGQLLYSEEMEGTFHQIDLFSFQKGVYFITIRSKDFVTTRKIIKL